jgi:hypothetical protein
MAMRRTEIRAEGFKEFSRDLSRLTGLDMATAEKVFRNLAASAIVRRAILSAISQGGIAARSAESIRVGGPGVVVYGGNAYDFGAEFGSYRYKQFETWRGNKDDAGYFLWPTVREYRDRKMLEDWWKTMRPGIKKAFPK